MKVGKVFVSGVLRSPAHRLLSGAIVLILVGRPEPKAWWRNFLSDRDIDVLVQGQWLEMTARVGRGADEPDKVLPLLDEYLKRFPRPKPPWATALSRTW